MKNYSIFYKKNPTFWEDENLTKENLEETHVHLIDIWAKNLQDVFYKMQAEYWSPKGQARNLILSKGLKHTSMSVGDCIMDIETGDVYEVAMVDFNLLS